jgi:methylmalonyl-CoA/ethylmalonyl-CoA epimerase
MTFIKRIERIALEPAREYFQRCFGATFLPVELIEDMGIRYQPFHIGESRMELLEATRDDSPVAKFLKSHGGPGVHHITYEVDDLDAAVREFEARGGRIAYRHAYPPGVTFEGHIWREAFVHPKDAFGVLIHLAEKKKV